MVKDHIDTEIGNPLVSLHGLLFLTDSKDNTFNDLCYISHGALVGTEKSPSMICPPRRFDPATQAPQVNTIQTELNITPRK